MLGDEIVSNPFRDLLIDVLSGTGAYNREDLADILVDNFDPASFAQIIHNADAEPFKSIGLSDHNISILMSEFTHSLTMKLDRMVNAESTTIQLQRDGEEEFVPLKQLSVGEMCSAVLSLVLLERDRPLLIDQPEDDLDHEFVIDSVVASIRAIKATRQLITTTHNPNIPVIGDAELVIKVRKIAGGNRCEIQVSGGLEIPSVMAEVLMLDGGKDAFLLRHDRYLSTTEVVPVV